MQCTIMDIRLSARLSVLIRRRCVTKTSLPPCETISDDKTQNVIVTVPTLNNVLSLASPRQHFVPVFTFLTP